MGRALRAGVWASAFARLFREAATPSFVCVHESNALPVPAGVSMIEAAAIPETAFTVWTNVFERGGLKSGETLLVHGGASGIGVTAIGFAKLFRRARHRHGRF